MKLSQKKRHLYAGNDVTGVGLNSSKLVIAVPKRRGFPLFRKKSPAIQIIEVVSSRVKILSSAEVQNEAVSK